ncbi:type VI secretion system tip protein VgrG [Oceanicola sp. D3]|uniref:type VI secretion system Vgr family protein n=1 Tax=Oceanicola sp. D3 TaxID=2587163 RepID=UPI0011200C32|nr:type VI secretion system tip protein TssI/VgrG [Oceanicola sp. D3]QDC09184.1 type VI secretion system tip protein VgrG [Oceanicola sp. D3]
MDGAYTQDRNLGWVETDLGKDQLLLRKFTGTDRLNELFEYTVRVFAPDGLDTDALMGTHCGVFLNSNNHGEIPFDGIVTEVEWRQHQEEGDEYDLTLRPWFWLAGLRRQQRIFHEKSVDEILEEVFSAWSGTGPQTHRIDLTRSYPKLEYTVQYGESDLAFARRMMERFGISFHFSHARGNHCMVLTDAHESMDELPGLSREYRPVGEVYQKDEEHFWEWREARGVTTGKVKLTDYNFKTPVASMLTEQVGEAAHAHADIESYDYPGVYPDAGEGRDVVGLRTTQERAGDYRTHAKGDVLSLKAGMRCVATGHYAQFTKGEEHLCLEASHSFTAEAYRSGSDGGADKERAYEGRYTLIPISRPFAPQRITATPVIYGPQTARVVGEGEIDCDEYGRILVRFHWDLADAYSMRCRVSQNWASKGWGGMVIPRIGMEVVVEFLEGDPDKPLVTGCVYNGRNTVPYALPANKTVSTFKSDTHQGSGYNEFRFEDEKDREEVWMHAQKDHNTVIENDESHRIGHDRSKTVGNNQVENIGVNKTIGVGKDHTESIGQDARHTIARDVYYSVGQNQFTTFGKDHIEKVGNILKQSVFADHLETVGRNYTGEIAGKMTLDVGQSITTNTTKHTLMAGQKFVIAGPGGKITIDGSGITLEAPVINLKGAVNMGGSGSAQVPTLQLAANEALPLAEECPEKDK